MSDSLIDDIDRRILALLQEDARNNTNAEISDRVGVAPSTVSTRLDDLEESGVVRGYRPDIDYDRAGFPLHVLFVCTSSITDRRDHIEQIRDLQGVVNVRELMTGTDNVHIDVVGESNDDITQLARAIDDLGLTISEEILIKNEFAQPASVFAPE